MAPDLREYSRFFGIPAKQMRGVDGYHHLGPQVTVNFRFQLQCDDEAIVFH